MSCFDFLIEKVFHFVLLSIADRTDNNNNVNNDIVDILFQKIKFIFWKSE